MAQQKFTYDGKMITHQINQKPPYDCKCFNFDYEGESINGTLQPKSLYGTSVIWVSAISSNVLVNSSHIALDLNKLKLIPPRPTFRKSEPEPLDRSPRQLPVKNEITNKTWEDVLLGLVGLGSAFFVLMVFYSTYRIINCVSLNGGARTYESGPSPDHAISTNRNEDLLDRNSESRTSCSTLTR